MTRWVLSRAHESRHSFSGRYQETFADEQNVDYVQLQRVQRSALMQIRNLHA